MSATIKNINESYGEQILFTANTRKEVIQNYKDEGFAVVTIYPTRNYLGL